MVDIEQQEVLLLQLEYTGLIIAMPIRAVLKHPQ